MDYVERLAREMWPDFDGHSDPLHEAQLTAAEQWLSAIAATGCKVVGRDMTENQYTQINWRLGLMREECEGVVSDVFDAAPAYPGANDEV